MGGRGLLTSGDRNTAGVQEIDVVFTKEADLLLGEAGVREHADLVDDVLPGSGGLQSLQLII